MIDLFSGVFGEGKAGFLRDRFDWQYGAHPARAAGEPRNWVIRRDGQIVGHFGGISSFLQVGKELRRAMWGVDLMTHPGHRGGRVIVDLFAAFEHGAAVPMGYGMADVVRKICEHRGWRSLDVGSVQVLVTSLAGALRLVHRGSTAAGRLRRHLARARWRAQTLSWWLRTPRACPTDRRDGWTLAVGSEPPPETDVLWEEVAAGFLVAARRTEVDLRWRYCRPGATARFLALRRAGRLEALAVLELFAWSGVRAGQVSELLVPRGRAAELVPLVVERALEVFAREHADVVLSDGFPGDVRAALARSGFRELVPGRTETLTWLDRRGDLPPEMADPDRWLVTAGDSDRSTPWPRLEWRS